MKIIHWSYTRKYQVKSVFDSFPDIVAVFRQINGYYFIYTMKGMDSIELPSRKHYVQMEYLLNKELGTLPAYKNRKALQKRESS